MLELFQMTQDASNIYWFPAQHVVQTYFQLENLWISEPSLGLRRLDHRRVKCNCVFFGINVLFIFDAPKFIFSLTTIVKR